MARYLRRCPLGEKMAYITRLLTNPRTNRTRSSHRGGEIQVWWRNWSFKRSYVIDELYKRIPDEYKKYITEDNLDSIINKALEEAERLWANNPRVNMMVNGHTQT